MLWFAFVLKMILMTVLWPCNSRSGFFCLSFFFYFWFGFIVALSSVCCKFRVDAIRRSMLHGMFLNSRISSKLVFTEGVRTGEPQGVLNKCYWVTSTLLLLNWTVGKWISSTNRAFHSSLLEGSYWRDWVTNNFIFNSIQQPSQVCEWTKWITRLLKIWALNLYASLFKLI